MKSGFSIAIDGPVASGKGTVASALAKSLNGFFMNTGGMYRCVALQCIKNGYNMLNEDEVIKVLPNINVEFKNSRVFLNKEDVTERLKDEDVAKASSEVAVYEKVRRDLVARQQEMAKDLITKGAIVIAEGRDIGTRVLPNAKLKIFLTAAISTRAQRSMKRYLQRGIVKNLDDVLKEIKIRDLRDVSRKVDPLPSDPKNLGYWILDNSNQGEEETINIIMLELKNRGLTHD